MDMEAVISSMREIHNSVTDDAGKDLLKGVAERIAQQSVHGRDYNMFVQYLREFVNTVAFTVRLPVGPIKKLLRHYIDMWNNPELAQNVMKEVFDIEIQEDKDMLLGAPIVDQLDQKRTDIYLRALRQGREKVKNIRLMVVGMFQVGKTSLVNNLIEDYKTNPPKELKSTEGIDVHKCQIKNNQWKIYNATLEERMKNVVVENIKPPEVDIPPPLLNDPEPIEDSSMEIETQDPETSENSEEVRKPETNTANERVPIPEFMENLRNAVPLEQSEEETHQTANLSAPSEPVGILPTVSLWDFAGQDIYYTTHHFFLNNRSIYLLLMDISKPLDSKVENPPAGIIHEPFTCKEVFKFWLNSIHMYSSLDSRDTKHTVVLVGTHKDKLNEFGLLEEDEKEEFKDKYFDNALKAFAEIPAILKHIYPRKFLINNLDRKSSIFNEIQQTVVELASQQFYWNELMPARWIELERALDLLKEEEHLELIEYKRVEEADSRITYPINDEEKLRTFLQTQHALGNILYFETDELKETVILNPSWAIEAFKTFINHVKDRFPTNTEQWQNFELFAMLTPDLVEEFISKAASNVKPYKKEVLGYMEQLRIIAKPVYLEQSTGESITTVVPISVAKDFHIVPCLLRSAPTWETIKPLICEKEEGLTKRTPVLCLQFKDGFMPPAVFHRLQAFCIRTWPIDKRDEELFLYRGFGVFLVTGIVRLMIWYKDHRIYLRISVTSRDDLSVYSEFIENIRTTLELALQAIVPSDPNVQKVLPYEAYIQCDCCIDPGKRLYRKNDLIYFGDKACDNHIVDVNFALELWYKSVLDEINGLDEETKKEKLNRTAEDRELGELARGIDLKEAYWLLAIELGITQDELERLRHNHDKDEMFIFYFLCAWKNNPKLKTIDKLLKAMIALKMRNSIKTFYRVFLTGTTT